MAFKPDVEWRIREQRRWMFVAEQRGVSRRVARVGADELVPTNLPKIAEPGHFSMTIPGQTSATINNPSSGVIFCW